MKTLRPYQADAIARAIDDLTDHGSTLMVQATGLGKTVCFTRIAQHYLTSGRVMVIADRGELLEQARNEFQELTGHRPGLEKADSHVLRNGLIKDGVVCAMIQSLRSGGDRKRWCDADPYEFSLVIIDEADLAMSESYLGACEHFRQNPDLKLLGVTATPTRHDGKDLDELFASRCYDYPISAAIPDGWLVPVRQRYLAVEIDLNSVSTVLGDFNGKELRERLAEGDTLTGIVSDAVQFSEGRRTLVFSDSVENAKTITTLLLTHRAGCARLVTGETHKDERRAIFADYEADVFQYLVNVGVACRGFDSPGVSCIVLARPTKSINLVTQMLGRGTRALPGVVDGHETAEERHVAIAASDKPDTLILDVVAQYQRGRLPKVADILAGDRPDHIAIRADALIHENPEMLMGDVFAEAERQNNASIAAVAERAERLKLRKKSKSRDVMSINSGGGGDARTPDQQYLERYKIPCDFADAERARMLTSRHKWRLKVGLCSFPQMIQLERKCGYTRSETKQTTFAEASIMMTRLAANKWRPIARASA